MNLHFPDMAVINSFIEDTSVLAVVAYLLARGRMLELLFPRRPSWRRNLSLGLLVGLVGLTEVIFPGARYPYSMHTLIITFGALIGGLPVGLIAAATVTLVVGVLHTTPGALETGLTLVTCALISEAIRRLFGDRYNLLRGLAAGLSTQAGVVLLHQAPVGISHPSHLLPHALFSIPANGFGVLWLQLILNDARTRADSERHRLEAERAQTLVTEAQLTALRARVHPHFLFNALTSIAALCGIDAAKAEAATLRLSQLMRRTLESNPSAPLCLEQEIEYVQGYLEIEQYRLGNRLRVIWEVDAGLLLLPVPAFSLQTLVENAISHGIAPRMEPGTIRIVIRARRSHAVIAVLDNGVGMSATQRSKALSEDGRHEHGLQIASQQLILLYGRTARLRLFSRVDSGALAAFTVPKLEETSGRRLTPYVDRTDHR